MKDLPINVKQEIANSRRVGLPVSSQTSDDNQRQNLLRGLLFGIVFIVLSAVIGFFFGMPVVPGNTVLTSVLVPTLGYTLVGIFFSMLIYNRLSFLNKLFFSGGLQYAIFVFAGVFLVTLLVGIIKKNGTDSIVSCLFYSCLFLLPYAIYQSWIFYKATVISTAGSIWYLPEISSHVPAATVFLNSIRVKIKISPNEGASEHIYETTVPGRLSLGNTFSNFIFDEENNIKDSIELKDEEDHLYGWTFLTPSFLGFSKRLINADLSLNENNIKNNSTIIVRRVKNNFEKRIQLNDQ